MSENNVISENGVGEVTDKMRRAVKELMKDQQLVAIFGSPVDVEALNIPDYNDIIKEPMDLGTVMKRLEANEYKSDEDVKKDVILTFDNAMTYNPDTNFVHLKAKSYLKKFNQLLKSKKRGAVGKKRSVKRSKTEPPFKRGCMKVLDAIIKHDCSGPFLKPVDPVRDEIPDYLDVITYPMDLNTVKKKLNSDQYATEAEFSKDVQVIWSNCIQYNGSDKGVSRMARQLSQKFDRLFAREFPKV